MDRFFGSLARVVVRLRIPIILVWIAVAVVGTMTLPSMTSEIHNTNSQFLPASAPSSRAAAWPPRSSATPRRPAR